MFAAPHPIIVAAWTADAPSGFGGARVRPGLPSTTVPPSHSLGGLRTAPSTYLRGGRRRRPADLEARPPRQQRPGRARRLVGDGHGGDVGRPARHQPGEPPPAPAPPARDRAGAVH